MIHKSSALAEMGDRSVAVFYLYVWFGADLLESLVTRA